MARLLIVSNRLPVTVSASGNKVQVAPSAGGLATGLKGPHESSDGLWIGWPGHVAGLDTQQRVQLDADLGKLRTRPVHLTVEEVEGFYTRFSNGVLWPLFHYLIDRIPYESHEWETYQSVNRKFADVVCEQYRDGDLIWVHDYQLALVPKMVRECLPDARIGFFLHIPFPAAEVFRLLPWSHQILAGLLGADLIGFHTFGYVRQFGNALMQTLGLMPEAGKSVVFNGRETRFWAYPMGIDARGFDTIARDPLIQQESMRLRQKGGEQRLIVGIDRLDYTKGIPRRLLALERLLERQPSLRGNVRFVQVAVPSREGVAEYESFAGEVQQLVGRINGKYSTPTSVPIHFLNQTFSQRELVALYQAADVMLVTPLRDGMNLVAKEFVASRPDEDGVLVLSAFAGAASEMGEAVSVNPYDIDATAFALGSALEMPATERKTRMRAMRERVFSNDVHRWATDFIRDLRKAEASAGRANRSQVSGVDLDSGIVGRLVDAPRVLWLLDYDGTLVPFTQRPELAAPDAELVKLVGELASTYSGDVHIVSGRQRERLAEWFERSPVALHAEHGLWSRTKERWFLNQPVDAGWKEGVRPVFEEFTLRTPGSLVEEKTASLAWHYRMADQEYGERQASELKIHIAHTLSNAAVEVLAGDKVVEVKPHGVNKGLIAFSLLGKADYNVAVAIGDDETDESMFRALPEGSVSICVGARASAARYRLPDVKAVRALLRQVIDARKAKAADAL